MLASISLESLSIVTGGNSTTRPWLGWSYGTPVGGGRNPIDPGNFFGSGFSYGQSVSHDSPTPGNGQAGSAVQSKPAR